MVYEYYNKKAVRFTHNDQLVVVLVANNPGLKDRVVYAYNEETKKSIELTVEVQDEVIVIADSICPLTQWNP